MIFFVPMKQSQLRGAEIASIGSNPFRDLGRYPFMAAKLESLKRSIESTGFWEGLIARPHPEDKTGFQIAFGHHRLRAAVELGLKAIPLIIKPLSDKQMLEYMGRENLEDYRSDFLIQLETWEAAVAYLKSSGSAVQDLQPFDNQGVWPGQELESDDRNLMSVARLLGWTLQVGRPERVYKSKGRVIREQPRVEEQANNTARACAAASTLISGGWINRSDLEGLSVMDARKICERATTRMKQMELVGKLRKVPDEEIHAIKTDVSRAVKSVAGDSRQGLIASNALAGEVDAKAYRYAADAKCRQPFLAQFLRTVCGQVEKMLNTDVTAQKLKSIIQSIKEIERPEDKSALVRLEFELGRLSQEALEKQNKITKQSAKMGGKKVVTPEFKKIANG